MIGLRHIDTDGRRHLFAFDCPCGQLSRFAAEADTAEAARLALAPMAQAHVEREASQ